MNNNERNKGIAGIAYSRAHNLAIDTVGRGDKADPEYRRTYYSVYKAEYDAALVALHTRKSTRRRRGQ